jgi:hypothetical protein
MHPDPGQPDPEETIGCAEFRSGHRSLVHGELLAQDEVLQGELAMTAAEEREESKQVEQEGDHRADSLRIRADRSTTSGRTEFWRRTGGPGAMKHAETVREARTAQGDVEKARLIAERL